MVGLTRKTVYRVIRAKRVVGLPKHPLSPNYPRSSHLLLNVPIGWRRFRAPPQASLSNPSFSPLAVNFGPTLRTSRRSVVIAELHSATWAYFVTRKTICPSFEAEIVPTNR